MTEEKRKYCLKGPSENGQIEDLLEGKDDKDSRQRLQALIAEWLRMENLVVLTGSGCSVSCGGKTIENLEKAVLEAVGEVEKKTNDKKALLSAGAKALIVERQKEFSKRQSWAKIGFEEWLSYLVNTVHLMSDKNSPIKSIGWKEDGASIEDVDQLVSYISKAIYAECALTLPDETGAKEGEKQIAPHLAFLSKLVTRDSNLGRTHLFTLNYDTLFEQALEILGVQYFDGFTGKANARFDPAVYGLDIYYPGEVAEGRVRRFDKFLHYYKLHGSIHWKIVAGELRARHDAILDFEKYRIKEAVKKAEDLITAGFACSHKEFGILPTSNKFVQTLEMPYAHLFRSFSARLSIPQTFLLVLGYGFGDDHITKIIETALTNPALVMLVVEPRPDSPTIERISRYKELGKRAFVLTSTEDAFKSSEYKYATFDDFAKSVMPDVQWLDDFLRLRRFEKQLQKDREEKDGVEDA